MQSRKINRLNNRRKTRKSNLYGGDEITKILGRLRELLTSSDRKVKAKKITYKNPLLGMDVNWPETNNNLNKIKTTHIPKYISTFNVNEIFTLLTADDQYFFKSIYLPEISKMKSKSSGNPTYFTSNQVHREFGKNQVNKPGQYFTEDVQISMKAEVFHDRTVEELWAWYINKNNKLTELMESGKSMIDAMKEFPLNYKDTGNDRDIAIIDIVKPIFINCISRIINSYIKYGKKAFTPEKMETNYSAERELLSIFLNKLNKLYNDENPIYNDLFEVIYSYFRWYSQRHIDHVKKYLMERFTIEDSMSMVNRALSNGIFILPASVGTNFYKTIKSYCIPVINASIVNAMGHYMFLNPHTNFIHDILHLITISKRNALIPLYESIKPFFLGYEKLYPELKDDAFRNIFDYVMFGILHEDAGIMYYEDAEFNKVFDIQKCNIFGKPLGQHLKIKDPEPIKELSIFTYLQLLVITVKIMCCCIDTGEFDKHIEFLYTTGKKIPYKLANLNREINESYSIDFVKKSGDTFEIIGNQAHVMYVKVADFKKAIKAIDKLLTETGMYTIYFDSIEHKNKIKNNRMANITRNVNSTNDPIMRILKSVEQMEESMMAEMLGNKK